MFETIQPNGILKNHIKNYVVVETGSAMDFMPENRVFPCGLVSLVFHYGSPSKFKHKNEKAYVEPSFVICGQQQSYYDLALAGKTGMVLVFFKPQGVQSFFKLPMSELSNQNLALQDLLKDEASELEEKLFKSKNNTERIALLEAFLLKRLEHKKDFDRISHAIRLIEQSKGQVRTRQLASEVCLGIKQFERIFSQQVGLNPKKFSGIIRFQNVVQTKQKFKSMGMYQMAIEHGYFDQSHFIHDFKSLTGLTPAAFFKAKI